MPKPDLCTLSDSALIDRLKVTKDFQDEAYRNLRQSTSYHEKATHGTDYAMFSHHYLTLFTMLKNRTKKTDRKLHDFIDSLVDIIDELAIAKYGNKYSQKALSLFLRDILSHMGAIIPLESDLNTLTNLCRQHNTLASQNDEQNKLTWEVINRGLPQVVHYLKQREHNLRCLFNPHYELSLRLDHLREKFSITLENSPTSSRSFKKLF